MKKVFTIIAAIAISAGAFAQQIPNGGFETWTSPLNPDQWTTVANAYGGIGSSLAKKDTTAGNYILGSASMRLFNDSVPAAGGVIISQTGLGGNSSAAGLTFFGYPYTKRPDSLFFYVKYTPGPGAVIDTASVQFNLTKAGTSLFGGVGFVPVTNTAISPNHWTEYILPLIPYYLGTVTGAPDTLLLSFSSGNLTKPSVYGSTMWIDGVHFDASVLVTGIEDVNGPVLGVNAYPNPTSGILNITVQADEVGSQITLTDMEGREVYNGMLTSTKTVIDTRSFQSGVYSIRVNSIDKMTTYKGKVSVTQ